MEVVRHTDPRKFLAAIDRGDEGFEARNNLVFGVAGTLVERPGLYETYNLWTVEADGLPLAAAVRTPPFHPSITDASDPEAVRALAAGILEDIGEIEGVIGAVPTVDWFVAAAVELTGARADVLMREGVFRLDTVAEVPVLSGLARPGAAADEKLLVRWFMDFQAEALPREALDEAQARRAVGLRLDDNPSNGLWVWEVDGRVVSMSGYGGPTPNGARIGPVYTPPDLRGHGFATALVAAQTRWLLDHGRRFCFLFTDLSNPTSNSIYERIGYRKVAEAAHYGFTR
jgi:RimJ/RimL family protein N-acetyltransferase